MLFHSTLVIGFFLAALLVRINRSLFYDLAQNCLGLVNVVLTDLEEDVKITQVEKSSNKLLVSFSKMFVLFLLALSVACFPLVIYCLSTETDYSSLSLSSFYSILSISIGATVPFLIPMGKKEPSNYSELSQLLHHLALDNYRISEKLFRYESKLIKRKNLKKRNDFVVISGLARAGTTSLMNDLAKISCFVSLNYANMPFILCPNLWAKFYNPKADQLEERSHKDGILIGHNSNEALEEYFFKVKMDDSFVKDTHLSEHKVPEEDYTDYIDYQTIIKLDDKKIYLSKNNNFCLRYNSIRDYNDDFVMVILYRDPLAHATSLLEKHRHYSKLQKEDPFVLDYMNWLGHHEFGLNQKPFVFNDATNILDEDKNSIDFWLKSWINYYNHVLTIQHPNTLLFNYDAYCNNPEEVINTIVKKLGIQTEVPAYQPFRNTRKNDAVVPDSLLEEAQGIYQKLVCATIS